MMEEHGEVLTLLADEQLRVGVLFVVEFQARAAAVSTLAQSGHELGEWAFFDKEFALAVKAPE